MCRFLAIAERLITRAKVYDERLAHIRQQQATLDRLSTLLGPPWQPSKPLEAIASTSRSANALSGPSHASSGMGMGHADGKRTSGSTQTIAQAIALGHAHTAQGQTPHDTERGQWYDVRESVVEEIDQAVTLALAERVRYILLFPIIANIHAGRPPPHAVPIALHPHMAAFRTRSPPDPDLLPTQFPAPPLTALRRRRTAGHVRFLRTSSPYDHHPQPAPAHGR